MATSQSSKIASLAIFTRTPNTPGKPIRREASLPIKLSSKLTCSAVHSAEMTVSQKDSGSAEQLDETKA